MNCINCGQLVDTGLSYCPNCGTPISKQAGPSYVSYQQPNPQPQTAYQQPTPQPQYQQPAYGQPQVTYQQPNPQPQVTYQQPQYQQPVYSQPQVTYQQTAYQRPQGNPVLILIFGIVGLASAFWPVFSIAGIVFSAIAMHKGKNYINYTLNPDPKARVGRGLAIAGLVLSIIFTVIWICVWSD